jgi:Flp pilus assembly protein TadG
MSSATAARAAITTAAGRPAGPGPATAGTAAPGSAPAGGVTVIVTPARHPELADGQGQSSGPGQPGSRERGMIQRRGAEADRGSLTLMLAVLFVALLALAGVVIDGGAKLTAAENAAAVAQEAARAGAGMVNEATAHANGSFVVDENQAIAAANQYLSSSGYAGHAAGGPGVDQIQVTVTVSQPTKVLSIIGIDTITATGKATANLVSGVTGPGQ